MFQNQVERIAKMVEVGSLPKGDLLNTESQKAQEELQLINAQNQRDIAKLNLMQLLDLSVSNPLILFSWRLMSMKITVQLTMKRYIA